MQVLYLFECQLHFFVPHVRPKSGCDLCTNSTKINKSSDFDFEGFYFLCMVIFNKICKNKFCIISTGLSWECDLYTHVTSDLYLNKYNSATIKQQSKFANNFCLCVIVVVIYLTSRYFIKFIFLMLM